MEGSKDEVFFLNHIEDIWEENEMDHGRTWKERRDEHGRILHLQDKASWMRSKSRQSRLRFTNYFFVFPSRKGQNTKWKLASDNFAECELKTILALNLALKNN